MLYSAVMPPGIASSTTTVLILHNARKDGVAECADGSENCEYSHFSYSFHALPDDAKRSFADLPASTPVNIYIYFII